MLSWLNVSIIVGKEVQKFCFTCAIQLVKRLKRTCHFREKINNAYNSHLFPDDLRSAVPNLSGTVTP